MRRVPAATLSAVQKEFHGEENQLLRKRFIAALAALAIVTVGVTTWTALASARSTGSLSGAGSTFVVPLVTTWTQNYHGSQVSYSGIGSGGGIAAITARTVDFGASDAPLTPDQATACKRCAQIPWAFSATSIPYNVSGVSYGLKLTGPILANIYLGKIKKWNDSRIKSINPGVNLPNEDIVPIYRSDGSGTSYNFTDYLSHVSKEWKNKIGKGTQPSFPTGVGARGSSGVARQAPEHTGRHHVRRRRLLAEEPLQDREDQEPRWEVPAAGPEADPGRGGFDHQAQEQPERLHGCRPKSPRAQGLPHLHVHLGDRAPEDEQGARPEEVHYLGAQPGDRPSDRSCSSCRCRRPSRRPD